MTDTLRSICEQCIQLQNPQLNFIPPEFERHREILARDLRELVSLAESENEKSVVVLGGSILESILYTFIQAQSGYIAERRGIFEFDPDHSLRNFVEVFNRWLKPLVPTVVLSDSLIESRDLVHINRELAAPPGICATAARDMLRTLNTLLEGLAEFAVK